MTELAFNANGESFEIPATVTAWRVRRMKPRGAPELVYGRDGRPLTLPIDADMDDLRNAVAILGKYRLDPINDDGKTIENVPAAYIQVVETERPLAPVPTRAGDDTDSVIREAMRLNTELARSVIEKFPEVMQAAAELLRAADGAGIPARTPRVIELSDDDEEDGDDHEPTAPRFDLAGFLGQVVPLAMAAFKSGNVKMPDLASTLDWRKAVPKTVAAPKPSADVATRASEQSAANALPPLDPQTMAHFIAVQSALRPEEAALAREVASELAPAELRAWFDELAGLSVPDAVAKIRDLIGKGGAS